MWFLVSVALASDPIPPWMVGCWTTQEAPLCREVWSAPRAKMALGHTVCEGDWGASWEHLWVGDVDGVRTMVIHPSGQEPHAFPLVEESADELVFADPAHDFPQRIVYSRTPTGPRVVVAGHPKGAEPTTMTLRFASCDGAVPSVPVAPKTGDPPG